MIVLYILAAIGGVVASWALWYLIVGLVIWWMWK